MNCMKRFLLLTLFVSCTVSFFSCSDGESSGGSSSQTQEATSDNSGSSSAEPVEDSSGTTVTDSELDSYTYFYLDGLGISRSTYIFDNKGTADSEGTVYFSSILSTGTTLKALLSKHINTSNDYSLYEKKYTFIEGAGAKEGEGLYFGVGSDPYTPYVAIQYDGKLYLVLGDLGTSISKSFEGIDYYTADNFQTIKTDIITKIDEDKKLNTDYGLDYPIPYMHKVDPSFTVN